MKGKSSDLLEFEVTTGRLSPFFEIAVVDFDVLAHDGVFEPGCFLGFSA